MNDVVEVVAASAGADAWVSELQINDEAMNRIVLSLAAECHGFATARGIAKPTVEDYLGLCHRELTRNLHDLITVSPVVTGDATKLGLSVRIRFAPAVYRRTAEAAKNGLFVHDESSRDEQPTDQAAESSGESIRASGLAWRDEGSAK